ncbi:MAG TPA: hypothetical protein VF214_05355, partial [Edaphobacter sp.]
MMVRSITIFLLVLAFLWGLIDAGIFALFGGFFGNNPPHDPVLIGKVLLSVWWVWIGPLLMVMGSVLLLRDTRSMVGVLSAFAGCTALTITMAYQMVLLWRDITDPLVAKSAALYPFYAVAVVATVLADVGVGRLYRLT